MNGDNVGSIVYDARIDTGRLTTDSKNVEKIVDSTAQSVAKTGSKGFGEFSQKASTAFGGVADSIERLAKVATGLFVGGALGVGAFVKQASELQGMRASFESMTGSAEAATSVMQQLNKFSFETAFKASEINAAARTFLGAGLQVKDLGTVLKNVGDIAGATGADLGRLTLPLSQALARGKLQTQDFYQILDSGAGKLGQVLREELTKRGVKDFTKAMEEGKVTSQLLFDVIAKSAAKGGFAFEGAIKQSKTFEGQMSNLQETIGNVALSVIGVDKATGQVDPNGIFARLSKTVENATKWLNENKDSIEAVANTVIKNAVPGLAALAAMFITARGAAIGFAVASGIAAGTISVPFLLAATAITAVVGALTFLQIKFDIFGTALEWIIKTWQRIHKGGVEAFTAIANKVGDIKDGVFKFFGDRINDIEGFINDLKSTAKDVFDSIKGWIEDNEKALKNWGIVITTIVLPKIVQLGARFTVMAAQAVASFVAMSASAVANALITSAAWIASAAATSFAWLTQTLPKIIAGFAIMAAQAALNAGKVALAFIAASLRTTASWAITFASYAVGLAILVAQTAIAAIKLAASWALALGPIGLIAAGIIGLTLLIINNWETVKRWFTSFWSWLSQSALSTWNTIKGFFVNIGTTIGNAVGNAFKVAVNGILGFLESRVNDMINTLNSAIHVIDNVTPGSLSRISKISIPKLAEGGIVQPRPGGVIANIAEAGQAEAVIPLDKLDSMMSGKGVNVTINMSGIMARSRSDLRDIGKDIIQAVNEDLKARGIAEIGGGQLTGGLI